MKALSKLTNREIEKSVEISGSTIYGYSRSMGNVGGDAFQIYSLAKEFNLHRAAIENPSKLSKYAKTREKAMVLVVDGKGHDHESHLLSRSVIDKLMGLLITDIKRYGETSLSSFEELNTSFYNNSKPEDFVALSYAEIDNNGLMRYILAGNNYPIVYSNKEKRIISTENQDHAGLLVGLFPSLTSLEIPKDIPVNIKPPYKVQEIKLNSGDIAILSTDGFTDVGEDHKENYNSVRFVDSLEHRLRHIPYDSTAHDISCLLKIGIDNFTNNLDDDLTYVVIKKD